MGPHQDGNKHLRGFVGTKGRMGRPSTDLFEFYSADELHSSLELIPSGPVAWFYGQRLFEIWHSVRRSKDGEIGYSSSVVRLAILGVELDRLAWIVSWCAHCVESQTHSRPRWPLRALPSWPWPSPCCSRTSHREGPARSPRCTSR
jgi:hypothetical protein